MSPPNRAVLIDHEHIRVRQCRHGLFAYNINDLYIGRSLDVYGEWAESEVALLQAVVDPGHVFVDVGANIGTHTVPLAKRVTPSGLVIAVEPQPLVFQMLCANVALNALMNVRCLNAVASDVREQVRVPIVHPSSPYNFGSFSAEHHQGGEHVGSMRIDDLDLERCHVLKIDVEGMECRVIRGARRTIGNCRPVIFVENSATERSRDLLSLLYELDYVCWWHLSRCFNPQNYFENADLLFPETLLEVNMICFHKEVAFDGAGLWPVEGIEDTYVEAMRRRGILIDS